MRYTIDISNFQNKEYYSLGDNFKGVSNNGDILDFTNYYMRKNEKPFFGISGEFHFSRMDDARWEDEIVKMKMCGINVIATYIFWIHHEEEEGVFDFTGCRNLRKFIELCEKHEIYVIIRIGPFDHGEVRNGGIPDWMYGKPFEVRKLGEDFLYYTRRLYSEIYGQIKGHLYKDGGPIIATQIDNEYMHSSAPWEITTGISNEWVFGGDEKEEYMLALLELAKACGIQTPFYTCTGWGGAITPNVMMPLWGGYAYRPWLFYEKRGEHPSTEEYIYQDYHNNDAIVTSDFKPAYNPEDKPYACCEMGGGMTQTYNYRFSLPFKSVDAMANIKIASGCNFLGYYVFQGGTNPKGKNGTYMNESQVPKMSYDYQAALGEFGQVRESYNRLRIMHLFFNVYGEKLCGMQTALPEGASYIEPDDLATLRYALRTDGVGGFVFINNFQDHEVCKDKVDESILIRLPKEEILFENISLVAEENCILPFNMSLAGINLQKATAQPITYLNKLGKITYVFLKPEGMQSIFTFEKDAVTSQGSNIYTCDSKKNIETFNVCRGTTKIDVLCIDRYSADSMYQISDGTLLFTKGAVMEKKTGIHIETKNAHETIGSFPKNCYHPNVNVKKIHSENDILDYWEVETYDKEINVEVKQTAKHKYEIIIPDDFMDGLKDVILQIDYQGDIAHAFINGNMINDNFCNGNTWEIGLYTYADVLMDNSITISITPLKEGANVNVESAMAARMENAKAYVGRINKVKLCPVYEFVV